MKHGYSAYGNGSCRCPVCRKAFTTYCRERRRRFRENGLPAHVQHGTINAYNNYGCRCDSCRQARTAYFRDYRQRRRQSA